MSDWMKRWLSSYDPEVHKISPSGRQISKSAAHAAAYGMGMHKITQTYAANTVSLPTYTQEQHDAFAAAIEELDRQCPVVGTNRGSRKKRKARAAAVNFARQGSINEAFARAIYGGMSKEQLRAIETLIFG